MSICDRLGFDAGDMSLEDALAGAARYGFHYVDFNADQPPNTLNAWHEA
jgi:sugar phosphate isomerase/epimerase